MTEVIKQKTSSKKINFPIIFLVFILLSTVLLYWYNFYIESDNEKIQTRISEKEVEINKIKDDKNIQVYALISDNKKTLNKLELYSDITNIMKGLTYIKNNHFLILNWFNYSNWVVTTKALTDPEKVSNAYVTTYSFIEKYRKDKDPEAIFKLPYISKVIWNSQMAFNLKLEVKDNLINNKK